MNAIIKHENVYVWVKNKEELRADANLEESIFYKFGRGGHWDLYGGRVVLHNIYSQTTLRMEIDGIPIYVCEFGSGDFGWGIYQEKELEPPTVVAYLNQIEHLGVDPFLDNYKKQLQEFKKDVENLLHGLESNSKNESLISKLQKVLGCIIVLIFSLSVNMNVGLTNQHYANAYETIVNTYFN